MTQPEFQQDVAVGASGNIPVTSDPPRYGGRQRRTSLAARGEPMVWLTGGLAAVAVLMILALLLFVLWQGITTFWPAPVVQVTTSQGRELLGEPSREDIYTAGDGAAAQQLSRTLYKTGNYDLTGEDFVWVSENEVASTSRPEWAMTVERLSWGNAYGMLEAVTVDGETFSGPEAAWEKFQEVHPKMRELHERVKEIEKHEMGAISEEQDEMRLELRAMAKEHGEDSPQYSAAVAEQESRQQELTARYEALRQETQAIYEQMNTASVTLRSADGQIIPADRTRPDEPLQVWQVVRAYPANRLDFGDKLGVYFGRWGEYLTEDPREANTEGGVYPAIVGTVLLTMIMVIVVVPIGVVAAIYLREYAKQGLLVSIVRISVNNLAGVPSIVYGVFGLGFFCYLIGGGIDQLFFEARLPDPTVGKSAMIWASLTLALLTLPVVIVATEEALAAVPKSMREGSYACGASKWQTIHRIVLPRALPGIMTGMILAIARGAGEVAPLMLVGAVKLAPELPLALDPPFFGTDRSFMHLGFHIYDLGFQSRNSEAAKSMVYTTTLLLITLVISLNVLSIFIRSRLQKTYAGGQF